MKVSEAVLADVCFESSDLLSDLLGNLRDLERQEERDEGWPASRRGDGLDWRSRSRLLSWILMTGCNLGGHLECSREFLSVSTLGGQESRSVFETYN